MNVLGEALEGTGLSPSDLWLRYLGIGGLATPAELEAYVQGTAEPDDRQYDLIAAAINDRHVELGGDHPVAYRGPTYELPTW